MAIIHLNQLTAATYSMLKACRNSMALLVVTFNIMWTIMSLLQALMTPIASPMVVFLAKAVCAALFLHGMAFVVAFAAALIHFL